MVSMLSNTMCFSELPQKLHAGKTLHDQQCFVKLVCLGFCLDDYKLCSPCFSVQWHGPSGGNQSLQTNDYCPERLKASDGCAGWQGMSAAVDSLIKQLAYLLK